MEGLPGRMPISRVKGLPSRVRSVASPLLSIPEKCQAIGAARTVEHTHGLLHA